MASTASWLHCMEWKTVTGQRCGCTGQPPHADRQLQACWAPEQGLLLIRQG